MGVQIKHVLDGNGVKFYPITIANAVAYIKSDNSQVRLSDFLNSIDYSGKADKVSGATNGNFAGLDSNGNLTDSGSKASDFKTKQTAVADSDATTDGTGVTFVDSVTQNTNGEITVHKKGVQLAQKSTSGTGGQNGLMSAAQAEKLDGIEAGADVNIIEGVQVNGSDLTPDGNKKVNVTIAEGSTNGSIAVNGTDVDVHGLGSAAYTASTAYDAAGAAAAVLGTNEDDADDNTVYGAKAYADAKKAEVIGTNADTASANTIYGAKAYADALVAGGVIYQGTVNAQSDLPDGSTTAKEYKKGWYYKVATAGTYFGVALQVGDALLANKDYTTGATAANDWDILQGSVAVSSEDADLVIGTLTKIATVEGVEIKVKQVEDTTKLECAAVADTTEYADVSSLFTAPAQG